MSKTTEPRWALLLAIAVLLGAVLCGLWLLLPSGTPLKSSAAGDRALCLDNLYTLGDALKAYAAEHGGRMPGDKGKRTENAYAWVDAVRPYLVRAGLDPDAVLYCGMDDHTRAPSSFAMPEGARGKERLFLISHPKQPVLVDKSSQYSGRTPLVLYGDALR